MKNSLSQKLLATILSVALLLNSSAVAFATDAGIGADGAPIITASETVTESGELGDDLADCTCPPVDSGEVTHSEDCPLYETPPQSDCTCPPVDSGEVVHGKNCPLYEKPVEVPTEAITAVYALIAALPTIDKLAEVDTDAPDFADYLAKLRLDVAAARAAYDALTDEENAAFDAPALAKLTALEEVLAAMPLPMSGNAITITVSDGTTPKTGGGDTLAKAVTASNVSPFSITALKITAGTVTAEDWKVLKDTLTDLQTFEIDAAVTPVANIPDSSQSIVPTGITSVIIPQAITVGNSAFSGCTTLANVNLPAATSIGEEAFYNCFKLTTVELPAATSIGTRAFENCRILTTATLPAATSIGDYAFYKCAQLSTVSLPAMTTIGRGAFSECNALVTLKLPATPPTGSDSSFANCPQTNPLVILDADGDELTDPTALATAIAAYKATADGNVTDNLWYGWTLPAAPVLPKITITVSDGTDTKTGIGGDTLAKAVQASDLTASTITTLKITAGEVTADDWNYFAGGTPGTTTSPFTALETFEVADEVTSVADIPDGRLFPSKIKTVTIPQVIKVGKSAFSFCTSLTSVSLPKATSIGEKAFYTCWCLENASLPAVTTIGSQAFDGCYKLTTLKLPASPPKVADTNAFKDCPVIRDVILVDADGNELTSDALKAAQEAYDRTDTSITGGTDTDGLWYGWLVNPAAGRITIKVNTNETFYKGNNLQNAFETSGQSDSGLTKLIITEGCMTTEDWEWLVKKSSNLSYFEILDTVYLVNDLPDAMNGSNPSFPKLHTFIVPQAFKVGNYAFSGNNNLTTVNLPKATAIGMGAFKWCGYLKSLDLPEVKTLSVEALYYCEKLETLSLPKVTYFSGKDSLSYIQRLTLKLPGSSVPNVTEGFADTYYSNGYIILVDEYGAELTDDALKAAINLYKADEGYNATDNKWYAWRLPAAAAKITITVNGGATPYGGTSLSDAVGKALNGANASTITSLKITKGEVTADDWKYFAGSIPGTTTSPFTALETFEVADEVTTVADIPNGTPSVSIFPENIKSVTISKLVSAGEYSFYNRTALTSVKLPMAESVPDDMFSLCTELTSVDLPKVKSIGEGAFYRCKKLTGINLPEATSIGVSAFSECTNLTSVSMPKLTSIDDYAFYESKGIATLKLPATPPTVTNVNAFGSMFPYVPTGSLTILGADGTTELTGDALTRAQAAYDAVTTHGNAADDGKWYVWKVRAAPQQPKITITVTYDTTTKTDIGGTSLSDAVTKALGTFHVNAVKSLKITAGEVTDADWRYFAGGTPGETDSLFKYMETFEIDAKVTKVGNIPNGMDKPIFPASIKTVTIPQKITVGNHAFRNCGELLTAHLPAATDIGDNTFYYCEKLATVNLDKVISIGVSAFGKCTSLVSVSLPKVTGIGVSAFSGCAQLATLQLPKDPPSANSYTFFNCHANRNLTFVDTDGNPLTDTTTLATAIAAYDKVIAPDTGTDTDGLWFGWKIDGNGANVAVTGVTVVPLAVTLEAGKTAQLTATVAPANATNKEITWNTSNPAAATVDAASGKVTAVKEGRATITATTTDGGKKATCAVTVTAATSKPAPGGKLEAPLTQDKVDGVFGEGNATLNDKTTPPTIKLEKDITPEKPIELETDVKIDLGGNTITGKPGQPPIIVGENDKVTVGGDGTVAGGDNSSGTGGNGITGGTDSDITIGDGVTVEGGDGTTGGDGIQSGGDVTVGGDVNGGNGSNGNGGDGVDTSGGNGNVVIGGGGTANGGDSTGGNGNGGNGITGGTGDIIINGGGTASGGNGNGSGNGGDGSFSNGDGDITNGGSSTGGNGGNAGGNGGNGTSTDAGDTVISGGGSSTGGNGGSGATGGTGGDGADSGTITIENGGTANGGNGGTGTGTGGNGGDGSNSSGKGDIDGTVSGGNGGAGGTTGGNGGNGAASGSGGNAGDINIGGKTEGGDGGTGGTTGGTGGNGTTTGGDINVAGGGSSTGGNGGSSSTGGGNGGNGTNTSGGGTTVNGGANGGNGGNGNGNGSGGNGGNGASQGGGTVGGGGTANGGNGGNGAGTGAGGTGGTGVGGGATAGGGLTTKDGINGLKATTNVDDSKSGTTVTVPDKSTLANAALTAEEKKDKNITEISVTLSIEKKNNQPDKVEVDKVLSSEIADTIGAFFDITLDKIITNAGGAQPSTKVTKASEEIQITITIPANMRGGSNYVVIRVHNGVGESLPTSQTGNDLTFSTDKFSTYAIAYTKSVTPPTPPTPPTDNTSGGGSSSSNDEYDFWMSVKDKINSANSGDVIKVHSKSNDKMPESVMAALRKNPGVTLVISWNGGKTITIPAGKAAKQENGRIYWPLSLLAEMYNGIEFVEKPTDISKFNPETGGGDYIAYADGKQIPITGGGELTTLEAPALAAEKNLSDATENAQAIAPVQPKPITPPNAGFEADAFAGTPDAKQANRGNVFAVIALMLSAVAVGSGVWFWKRRTQTEKQ